MRIVNIIKKAIPTSRPSALKCTNSARASIANPFKSKETTIDYESALLQLTPTLPLSCGVDRQHRSRAKPVFAPQERGSGGEAQAAAFAHMTFRKVMCNLHGSRRRPGLAAHCVRGGGAADGGRVGAHGTLAARYVPPSEIPTLSRAPRSAPAAGNHPPRHGKAYPPAPSLPERRQERVTPTSQPDACARLRGPAAPESASSWAKGYGPASAASAELQHPRNTPTHLSR